MSQTNVHLGFHKYCGGFVFRVSVSGTTLSYRKCDVCMSSSLDGTLGEADIVTDPTDESVEGLISQRLIDEINKYAQYID